MGAGKKFAAAPGELPLFAQELCLNRRQNRFTCSACADICPEKVFSLNAKESLKWDRCSGCGLCVSACPARCFTPAPEMQETLLGGVHPGETVVFGCEESSELLERKLPCLAAVPWELPALLSFYSDVVLLLQNCASCTHAAQKQLLEENLRHLRDFLGEERFNERIRVIREGSWTPPKEEKDKVVSRRGIFSGMKQTLLRSTARAVAARLPLPEETEKDALQYRRMLASAVRRERDKGREKEPVHAQTDESTEHPAEGSPEACTGKVPLPSYGVELPNYTSACYGCGICARVCPQKAIEIGPEENGTRLVYIVPWKCTACRLCTVICPYGGLDGLRLTQVPFLEKLPLVKVASASCERCGIALRPGTEPQLCIACAAKARKKPR